MKNTSVRTGFGGKRRFGVLLKWLARRLRRADAARRPAEESLRASEERFRLLVESVQDYAIFMLDPGGRVLSWNAGAERIIGYRPEEILGEHFSRFDPAADVSQGKPEQELEIALAQGRYEEEGWRVRKDGSRFWATVVVTAVRDHEGVLRGFAEVTRDMTERRRAEEEILDLNRQLRGRLERIGSLRRIDIAITASLDLRVTLAAVLDEVTSQLGVHAAAVLLFDPLVHTLAYAAGRGFHGPGISRSRIRLDEGSAGAAALERRLIHLPDLRSAGASFSRGDLLAGESFIAYYAVPLVAKGQVKGVLELFHRETLNPDLDWLDFLETLAGQTAIAVADASLFDQLQRANLELTFAYDATIEGWSRALDLRDKETEGHSRRVTEMTLRLARTMNIGEAELVHVRRGALLHDIGKMGVPDSILLKAGPLTDEEWEVMRRHPRYAQEWLAPIPYLRPALDIPYGHHEKWDGTGYPGGLKGEQIPLAARIFAAVDVYDALRSDRPYRKGWPEEQVLAHIRGLAGTHFDPAVVEAFFRLIEADR